jgi:Tfp pilus assembly protein PilO
VDSAEIVNKIKQNLLNLVILIVAIIIAFKVYQSKEKDILALKNQKLMEEKKNDVLIEISTLEKTLAFLNNNVNNKLTSGVLDKIGDFANSASVKISRITPQKEIPSGEYTKYPYDVALSADNYHQIGRFVSLLENSTDIYMVENLAISKGGAEGDPISATLTVYTILINK